MAKVMIAWELGGGLGHVMRTSALARAFAARGVASAAVLRDLTDSSLAEWPADTLLLQAPIQTRSPHGFSKPATYAEVLYASGYHDIRQLDGLVTGWLSLIELVGPDLLLVDHSPTAILAGKIMGIPCVRLGTGFFAPPEQQPYPVFRTWEQVDTERARVVECNILNAMNLVAAGADMRFGSIAEALQPDADLISSWPELDHYAELRGDDAAVRYAGNETSVGAGIEIPWKSNERKRLVAYLKADYTALAEVLRALAAQDAEVIAYVAGLSRDRADALQTEYLTITTQPLSLSNMLERCDGLLCHAGSGAVALALEKDVPVFLLPMTAEQLVYAMRVEKHGFGVMQRDIDARGNFASRLKEFFSCPGFVPKIRSAREKNKSLPDDAIAHAVALGLEWITREAGEDGGKSPCFPQ